MNLSDTFYVALCMTVLILGVVYWFWTQNQHIQRKLNLLENIVYEMRSNISFNGGAPDPVEKVLAAAAAAGASVDTADANAPLISSFESTESAQIDDDDIDHVLNSLETNGVHDVSASASASADDAPAATEMTPIMENLVADELFEDLAPGGSALGVGEDVSDVNSESVLNSMGLKELRELAKQKGVAGTKNLRKHELVAAIRASKTNVTPFEIREGTLELN
jgi:hypothetical protein